MPVHHNGEERDVQYGGAGWQWELCQGDRQHPHGAVQGQACQETHECLHGLVQGTEETDSPDQPQTTQL